MILMVRLDLIILLKKQKNKLDWSKTLHNLLNFAKILEIKHKNIFSELLEPYLETTDELILLHNICKISILQ